MSSINYSGSQAYPSSYGSQQGFQQAGGFSQGSIAPPQAPPLPQRSLSTQGNQLNLRTRNWNNQPLNQQTYSSLNNQSGWSQSNWNNQGLNSGINNQSNWNQTGLNSGINQSNWNNQGLNSGISNQNIGLNSGLNSGIQQGFSGVNSGLNSGYGSGLGGVTSGLNTMNINQAPITQSTTTTTLAPVVAAPLASTAATGTGRRGRNGRSGRTSQRKLAKQTAISQKLSTHLNPPIGDPAMNHYRRGAKATVPITGPAPGGIAPSQGSFISRKRGYRNTLGLRGRGRQLPVPATQPPFVTPVPVVQQPIYSTGIPLTSTGLAGSTIPLQSTGFAGSGIAQQPIYNSQGVANGPVLLQKPAQAPVYVRPTGSATF